MGAKYMQDSVTVGSHGTEALVYTTGPKRMKAHRGVGWRRVSATNTDYSAISTSEGRLFPFILLFNFDVLTDWQGAQFFQNQGRN